MSRVSFWSFIFVLVICLSAGALTGSSSSATGVLETVQPRLNSVTVLSESSLEVTFSEPMLDPGVSVPGNYSLTGAGAGTLSMHPTSVSGIGPHLLTWDAGETYAAPLRMTVTGLQDVAGNPIDPAYTSVSGVGVGAMLPLHVWPVASVLLLVGVFVLRGRRSRAGTILLLLLAALLAAPMAFADPPTVSNVVFTQGPDGPSATKVDITYDLIAPNGPCMVTVSLSKDGGADGFIHPVTSVTGDLLLVTSGAGRHIVWDIAADYPNEAIPQAQILITADDGFIQHTLEYSADPHGHINGVTSQIIDDGEDGTTVTAVPDSGYRFVQWSDGVLTPSRTDTHVTASISVGACFTTPVTSAIPAGDFAMGRTSSGDDATGGSDELPVHTVTLGAYQIGKTEVTNRQYCDVLNWALAQSYLKDSAGAAWTGTGDIYAGANLQLILSFTSADCNIQYSGGAFSSKTRTGLPGTTSYSMNAHPVVCVSWYGAVAYCNWLSQIQGLTPSYDMASADWPLTTAPPAAGGYRLPTEAEWERAAAWDGTKHWVYGFSSDALTGMDRCNYVVTSSINPLGLTTQPYTSPGAWFDGAHVSPNGSVTTVNSVSPVGAYDMSGNADEWCQDWYLSTYYNGGAMTNPTGPATGTVRVLRGGSWLNYKEACRTARRTPLSPTTIYGSHGFRIASSNFRASTYTLTYLAGPNGSIDGVATQSANFSGNGRAVTATPHPHYHFVQWSDGLLTPTRTDTNIRADLTVTANFTIDTYMLTYTADANGSISGDSPQIVDYGSDGDAVTAVPNPGYAFLQWSDGSTENPRMDIFVDADITVEAQFGLLPVVTLFALDAGASTTASTGVTLENTATNSPTYYMASESSTFTGAAWNPYSTSPAFTLSGAVGARTVYFKVRNVAGESNVMTDAIFVRPDSVSVAAGAFMMGRTSAGDDVTYGGSDESPAHAVTLSAYDIGKGEATNQQYCDVLNWAHEQGYLKTSGGASWAGSGDIYAGGDLQPILTFTSVHCNIQYAGGVFTPKMRVGQPGTTSYSMGAHPVVMVSWYGAVAFCNWLSQWQGLPSCYDMSTANWPLTVAPPAAGGYRLPTEAEWERAAAWDGSKHWTYAFGSDSLTGSDRCNYWPVNPLGLAAEPYTSPVAWFDGVHVSPNGTVTTVNSVSPVGAYDMSGNVWEWCHDWYLGTYYSGGSMSNPTGPATGTYRVPRGGSWLDPFNYCRSAARATHLPNETYLRIGFRVAWTPSEG